MSTKQFQKSILERLNDKQCSVCKNDFRIDALDEQDRCPVCAGLDLTPGFKEKVDYIQGREKSEKEFEEKVRKIVLSVLEEQNKPKTSNKESK